MNAALKEPTSGIEVTVCICTRDRPDELRGTLASVADSSHRAAHVIVSDDGADDVARDICAEAPLSVEYLTGPHLGLAANRNLALTRVTTPYVMFLDDDCRLAPDFFVEANACREKYEQIYGSGNVVVSGGEEREGSIVAPSDQSFLGFQNRGYDGTVGLNSVVINGTIFPTALTKRLGFDPRLKFGSEEVDLCTRMVSSGAMIVHCPSAVNLHLTSPAGRSGYSQIFEATASRLYATFKRYAFTERAPLKAAVFAVVAPAHAVVAGSRRGGPLGFTASLRAVWVAGQYLWSFLRERSGRSPA